MDYERATLSFSHALSRGGIAGSEGHRTENAGFSNRRFASKIAGHTRPQEHTPFLGTFGIAVSSDNNRYFWSEEDTLDAKSFGAVDLGTVNRRIDPFLEGHFTPWQWLAVHTYHTLTIQDLIPKSYSIADGITHTDWHNSRQALSTAVDAHFLAPQSPFRITAGYHISYTIDKSDGGFPAYQDESIPPSDTSLIMHAGRVGLKWNTSRVPLTLYCNGGKYYRLPSLVERFGGSRGLLPNGDLSAEQGYTAEVGIRHTPSFGYWGLAAFANTTRDAVYYHWSGPLGKPLNLDETRTVGIELNATIQPLRFLTLELHGTLQSPRNTSSLLYRGKLIPNEPVWSYVVKPRIGPIKGISLEYTVDHQSGVYRRPANLRDDFVDIRIFHHALLS